MTPDEHALATRIHAALGHAVKQGESIRFDTPGRIRSDVSGLIGFLRGIREGIAMQVSLPEDE